MLFSPKKPKTKIIQNEFKNFFLLSSFLASVVLAGFSVLSPALAATGINEQISFQGKVVNSDGTNVTNGSYTFLFCLYATGSPATPCTGSADNDAVWRESKSVIVTDGIFQTNLGDTTTLPGSVDFNTDNIYLGINFNGDGQMTPLVRFTAAPYALNAAKVGGLTVTDTTGTLTIPNGETISFAESFSTSGSFATTLTSTGITNVTLPTTGTLTTLAGAEVLTNKSIGSTGLVFSGATTDITTAAGEALTIDSGTTGTINIGTDASAETINIGNTGAAVKTIAIGNNSQANTITIGDVSVTDLSLTDNNWSISSAGAAAFTSLSSSGAIAANGGITFDASTDTLGAFTLAGTLDAGVNILTNIGNTGTDFVAGTGALTLAGVLTANGGIGLAGSQSFTASALAYMDLGSIVHNTTAVQGLRLPQAASATPSNPTLGEGYLAWDTAGNQLIVYNGASWSTVGGGSSDLQTTYGNDVDGSNVTISLTAADDGLIFTNPTSGGNNLSTFLLQLDQAHTTDAIKALDIVQASNAANAVNITANAIDGETGLAITTNGLTAGSALTVDSSSVAFTGNLAGVTLSGSNALNTGNAFAVSNTGVLNTGTSLLIQHNATGTNNLAVRVNDEASDTTPFVIDGAGSVGIGTTAPARVLDIFQASSAPQLRLSKDLTNYSEMTVDSAGDLLIGATGTDIRALSENVWVCDNDACPALTLTGDGNIFVENVIKFGNGVYMKNDSATELGVYDNDDQAMLIFDEL